MENINDYDLVAEFYDWEDRWHLENQAQDLQFYRRIAKRIGGPILELGCGTGRLAIPLAKAGYEVTGIDASAGMLAKAEEKTNELKPAVRERLDFVCARMEDYSLDREYSLIIVPYNGFLLLEDDDTCRAALECAKRHLKPEGLLILDTYENFLDHEPHDEAQHRWTYENRKNSVKISCYESIHQDYDNQVTVFDITYIDKFKDGTERTRHAPLRLRTIFRYQMELLLNERGFEVRSVYGDYNGAPHKPGSFTMLTVAELNKE